MDKWKKLSIELNQENAILGKRNSPDNLAKLHQKKLTAIILKHNEIIAFGALWPTENENFLELGSVWVKKEFRGLGLSSLIFKKIMAKIPSNKTIFSITHNKKVIHMLNKYNWKEVLKKDWEKIIPIELSCGPCDVVKNHNNCQLKGKKTGCAMFFFQKNNN